MEAQQKLRKLLDQLNTVIVGKPSQVRDCVACLLAGGHLLIEDVPGVGKTTLAHALARAFGLWDPLESTCRHASLSIL